MQIMRDEMKLVPGRSGGRFPRKRLCAFVFFVLSLPILPGSLEGEVSSIHCKPLVEVNIF